jgi:hypothetical protein
MVLVAVAAEDKGVAAEDKVEVGVDMPQVAAVLAVVVMPVGRTEHLAHMVAEMEAEEAGLVLVGLLVATVGLVAHQAELVVLAAQGVTVAPRLEVVEQVLEAR